MKLVFILCKLYSETSCAISCHRVSLDNDDDDDDVSITNFVQ